MNYVKSIFKATVSAAIVLASSGAVYAVTSTLNLGSTISPSATLQIADGPILPTFTSSSDTLPNYTGTGTQKVWLKGTVHNSTGRNASLTQSAAFGFGVMDNGVKSSDYTWGTAYLDGSSTGSGTFRMPVDISSNATIATDITSGIFIISLPLTFTQRGAVDAGTYTGYVTFTLTAS